jgi:hypothetical protein
MTRLPRVSHCALKKNQLETKRTTRTQNFTCTGTRRIYLKPQTYKHTVHRRTRRGSSQSRDHRHRISKSNESFSRCVEAESKEREWARYITPIKMTRTMGRSSIFTAVQHSIQHSIHVPVGGLSFLLALSSAVARE